MQIDKSEQMTEPTMANVLKRLKAFRRRVSKAKDISGKLDQLASVLLFTSLLVKSIEAEAGNQDQTPKLPDGSEAAKQAGGNEKTEPSSADGKECVAPDKAEQGDVEKNAECVDQRSPEDVLKEIDENIRKVEALQKQGRGKDAGKGGGLNSDADAAAAKAVTEASGFWPSEWPLLLKILGGVGVAAGGLGFAMMGGGGSKGGSAAPTTDTTPPQIISLASNIGAQTITLIYNENLDSSHKPDKGWFVVTSNGVQLVIDSVEVNGTQLILHIHNGLVAGSLVVKYTDANPLANDANAIQDAAGNDAIGFQSGVVADGYLNGARVYIDSNGNGQQDVGDVYVGLTNANGNFFLPDSLQGALLIVGGVNIDTGVTNTLVLRAPFGSTVINPLTTLVQGYLDAHYGASVKDAVNAVAASLGIPGTNLINYDPIASNDLAVQKLGG